MARILPFFAQQKSSVGIELGSNSLKMVETIRTGKGVRVLSYALIDAPDQPSAKPERDYDLLAQLVRQALSQCRMRTHDIFFSVSGYSVGFGRYRMPPMPDKELLSAIALKGAHDFPFPLSEAVLALLRQDSPESGAAEQDICVVAAHEPFVRDELSVFERCAVRPRGINAVASALASAVRAGGAEGVVAVLDLGARHTELAIIGAGRLEYARFIASGSEDIVRSLTEPFAVGGRQYNLSFRQAQQIKYIHGIPLGKTQETTDEGIPLSRIMFMMRPVLEKLVTEVLRSFDFYKAQTRRQTVEKIYICGGGAALKNLPEFLSAGVGIPAVVFDPFAAAALAADLRENEQFQQNRHRLGVAFGLSAGQCREANLLPPAPGGLATTNLRAAVPLLAAVLVVFLGLSWYLDARRSLNIVRKELHKREEAYAAFQPSRNRLQALKDERAALQTQLGQCPPIDPGEPALPEVFVTLTQVLPESVKLTALLFESGREGVSSSAVPAEPEPVLRLEGTVAAPEDYQAYGILKKVTDALKGSPLFQHAVLESTHKSDEQGRASLRFVVKAVLKKET